MYCLLVHYYFQILDWVLYSLSIGKFDYLRDTEYAMCNGVIRAFNRTGEIDKANGQYFYTEKTLNSIEKGNIKEMIGESISNVKSFKIIDKIEDLVDDTTYKVGDYIHATTLDKYGTIVELLQSDVIKFAKVKLYSETQNDFESGIEFTTLNSATTEKFVLINMMSLPLTIGIEGEYLWFVGKYNWIKNLQWATKHLK